MAVSKSDPERLYALIEADNNKGGVYVSYDRGDEFKAMSHRKELVNRPFIIVIFMHTPIMLILFIQTLIDS